MRRIAHSLLVLLVCTAAASAQVKISQIYGGGANSGAPLTRDYVELYNTSSTPVTMTNWSLQYAAAAGTFATTQATTLNGVIPGNGYWLVGLQNNSTATTAANAPGIPTPDTNGLNSLGNQIDLAATSGKLMLRSTTGAFTTALGQPTTTLVPDLVDFVGFGTAASSANWNEPATTGAANTSANNTPPPSATLAIYRNNCGASDSDNNRNDWNAGAPSPRNSATPANLGLSMIGSAIPWAVRDGDSTNLRCSPRLCGSNTLNPGTTATVNLSTLTGGLPTLMHDDGLLGDDLAGDGLYMLDVTIPIGQAPGPYNFPVTLTDGGNSGGGYLSIFVVAAGTTPANDNCRTATGISGPYSPAVTVTGNLTTANVESNPIFTSPSPMTTGQAARRGLWYTVTGTGTTLTADLCQSTLFDSDMMVFCGSCDGLTAVEVSDNFCNCNTTAHLSKASWCSQSGIVYYIWVASAASGAVTNSFSLRITDTGLSCKATTNCTTCAAAVVPQTEAEARYGPATNDGCDVQATVAYPGNFTSIVAPGPVPSTINGTSRGMSGNRDADWYRFLATSSGQLTASVRGQAEGYQISLSSLTAPLGTCPASAALAASPISGRCNSATMIGTVTAGTWYALRVICVGIAGPADLGPIAAATFFGGYMPAATVDNYTVQVEIAGQPLYDACVTPAWVPPSGTLAAGITGDSSLATLDGAAVACGTAVDRDCWFKFRPGYETPAWTIYTCNAATTYDTVLEVYSGSACGGTLIACNDDDVGCGASGLQSRLDVALMPGTDYYIRVCAKGFPAAGGAFNLAVVPGNDIVGRNMAQYAIPGTGGTISGNLIWASSEGLMGAQNSSCSTTLLGQRDLFYYFTPTDPCATGWQVSGCCGGEITIDTEVIISAIPPTTTSPNSVSCFDDGCVAPSYTLFSTGTTAALVTGTPYIVRVLGWSAGAGAPFSLSITPLGGGTNDNCASATTLTLPATTTGTTACGVTNDGTASCDPSGASGKDVWYKVTTSATGNLHFDTCGSLVDTTVAVYTGTCGSLTEIGCSDDATGCPCPAPAASLDLVALPAATYTIRVSTKATGGSFTLSVKVPVVLNDDCCSAIPVACGSITNGTTVGATADTGLPATCIGPLAPAVSNNFAYTASVWYSVTAPPTGGTIEADTIASALDSKLWVWTGTCGALTCVTANDDIKTSTFQSKVAWHANPNQTYYLMVGPFGTAGAFTLTVNCSSTPANDDCAAPTALAPVEGGAIGGTTVGACCTEVYTSTTAFPSCAATAPANGGIFDVWYTYTACANANVTFTTCGSLDTLLSVHSSCPGLAGPNNEVAAGCNDNGAGCSLGSTVTIPVTTGTTYRIRVSSSIGSLPEGSFTLTWAADGPKWYADTDGDGFGNLASSIVACVQPGGYVGNSLDCNDANSAINPNATEVCDGVDNDCDSLTDDADPGVTGQSTWYQDSDGDGYGNAAMTQLKCAQPTGYVSNSLDCNDGNSAVNPAAPEICNGIDDDCDLLTDDADPGIVGQPVWYQDSDGDGYGNPAMTQLGCVQPTGYVSNNTDCNDNNTAVNPAATEICNNIDDDCDSVVDEVCPTNDHCIAPTVIGDGSVLGDNSLAGSELANLTCGAATNDVWFSYTNPLTCTWNVTASLCAVDGGGAAFDAMLHVFTPPCGVLSLVTCNNNTCGTDPKVNFTLAGGASVLIAVSAAAPSPGGMFKLVVFHGSAAMSQIGPGCSDGGGPGPTLTLSALPVLCAPRTLSITGAVPVSSGMLMFDLPGTPTALTGGCPLYLTGGAMSFLFFIGTDAGGNWSASINVPCDPNLECGTFTVQGFLFPSSPPPFYQVTSGLSVTLGY